MQSRLNFSATFFLVILNASLLAGCSSTTQEMLAQNFFADSVGVVPADEDSQESNSPMTVIAVDENALGKSQEPTARAALSYDALKSDKEEEKKVVPFKTDTGASDTADLKSSLTTTAKPNAVVVPTGPVKLTQLYFDDRHASLYKELDDGVNLEFSSAETPTTVELTPVVSASNFSKFPAWGKIVENARMNTATKTAQSYFIPLAFFAIAIVLSVALVGYKWELKRVKDAERTELAKRNLWSRI
jgi:hypothetical protein